MLGPSWYDLGMPEPHFDLSKRNEYEARIKNALKLYFERDFFHEIVRNNVSHNIDHSFFIIGNLRGNNSSKKSIQSTQEDYSRIKKRVKLRR